jgi:adenylate cyclase
MRLEIERKFLVADDGWQAEATGGRLLRDGLVGPYHTSKVRVRQDGARSWLTVKGPRTGLGRMEFEYEVPNDHARAMLGTVCAGTIIEKVRYEVPHDGLTWEVDVYQGDLLGVTLAEVELEDEEQPFARPAWIGAEVSGDPRFKKAAMLELRQTLGRPMTIRDILAVRP